ncbi:MOSC domain-containing protein [Pengzhenrongella sicca]|uniref:MOSC domain-containing protein n=1 Tax=Pengzhenrongella sicca TaxID=2819238 RepID=A0A8A4ZIP6_9MICO|nr:MOSC domain-containing protein [Pengzhenrongella sicca]QTE30849.1 MOSC domain-containing protein [Pengzhenrongella sicca]
MTTPAVLTVNVAAMRLDPSRHPRPTGIDKRPLSGPARVEVPGPKGSGGVGLVGDRVGDATHHGGVDQAVYAYARADLDRWEVELGRTLGNGSFGENLTTAGLDVTGALIGERWRVGSDVVLEVSSPRIPCSTFARWLDRAGWVPQFTQAALPGAYLRVVEAGELRAGDPIEIVHRPDHDVSVGVCFRAMTLEPELLPGLLRAAALPLEIAERARRRTGASAPR